MFAIYGNNGLSFRSTIDNLYTLSNVDSVARVRNNTEEGLPKDHSIKNKKKLYESKELIQAKEIYKKVANLDTSTVLFHVKDIMTKNLITANLDNTLYETYNLMEEHKIKQVPILNNENNLVGLVTQEFILNLLINDIEFADSTMKKKLEHFELEEVISSDPITDIRRVAKVMVDFSLSAIPVVNQDDNLEGIVSRANILKAVATIPPLQLWG